MTKDFHETSDTLGGNTIMATKVCEDFCQFLMPAESKELAELEKEYCDDDYVSNCSHNTD